MARPFFLRTHKTKNEKKRDFFLVVWGVCFSVYPHYRMPRIVCSLSFDRPFRPRERRKHYSHALSRLILSLSCPHHITTTPSHITFLIPCAVVSALALSLVSHAHMRAAAHSNHPPTHHSRCCSAAAAAATAAAPSSALALSPSIILIACSKNKFVCCLYIPVC